MTQYSLVFWEYFVFSVFVMIANLFQHDRNPTVELK